MLYLYCEMNCNGFFKGENCTSKITNIYNFTCSGKFLEACFLFFNLFQIFIILIYKPSIITFIHTDVRSFQV